MREHDLTRAIKLASNETPLSPLPSVVQAIADAAGSINRYADHRAAAVRERIAAKYGVAASMVGIGCGSVGLLQQIALTYAGLGDSVAFGWLSFEAYPIFTQVAGATSITVPNRADVIDLDALAAAIAPTTRLVLLANPNNPTGTAFDRVTLDRFLAAVPSDVLVVLDEAYHEFVTDPAVPDGISMLADHPNLAVLRTFSKAYGLAGLRIGYLIADPEIVAQVDKTLIPFAVNHLAQVAALASLDAEAELLERCSAITSERSRVLTAVRALGLPVPDAQANFVWLPVGDSAASLTLALERLGVVTRPFAGAGVRVTISTPAENDLFLDALDSSLRAEHSGQRI
jgi:histidinol-phosphate aminotransferase